MLVASSLLESIVASIIFLLVFAIAMTTISQLPVSDNDNWVYIEADHEIEKTYRYYSHNITDEGEYTKSYEWGEMHSTLMQYGDNQNLQHLTIKVRFKKSKKSLQSEYIIECNESLSHK